MLEIIVLDSVDCLPLGVKKNINGTVRRGKKCGVCFECLLNCFCFVFTSLFSSNCCRSSVVQVCGNW
jgi:hypothetical protein